MTIIGYVMQSGEQPKARFIRNRLECVECRRPIKECFCRDTELQYFPVYRVPAGSAPILPRRKGARRRLDHDAIVRLDSNPYIPRKAIAAIHKCTEARICQIVKQHQRQAQ